MTWQSLFLHNREQLAATNIIVLSWLTNSSCFLACLCWHFSWGCLSFPWPSASISQIWRLLPTGESFLVTVTCWDWIYWMGKHNLYLGYILGYVIKQSQYFFFFFFILLTLKCFISWNHKYRTRGWVTVRLICCIFILEANKAQEFVCCPFRFFSVFQ